MPTSVLIFESDPSFAHDLEAGLQRFGCETTVADDANVGLQIAASQKPDLILLTIELPRMNGFSVCNKLKRDPNLQDVPLIIMSSDSTEETFEQHRRLRTRAEEYLHKPVSLDQLVPAIRRLIPEFSGPPSGRPLEDGAPGVADEDLLIDEAEILSARPPVEAPVDRDVDNFTEQAFDALIEKVPSSLPSAGSLPASGPSWRAPAQEAPREQPSVPRPSEGAAALEEVERLRRHGEELEQQLRKAKTTIAELEDAASRDAAKDAEVQRLRRELDETKARQSAGRPSSTAREFLDLREQLNRKDKEILEIRDQLTHRERDLLGFRENALTLERERADLSDRVEELDRKLAELERHNEALRSDKEQAGKRADDFKRIAEKHKAELDERLQELDGLRQQHTAALQEHDARIEAMRAEHAEQLKSVAWNSREEALAEAEQEKQRVLAAAQAEAEATHQQAMADQVKELERQHNEKVGALYRANEDALGKLRAEHEQVAQELLTERDAARTALAQAEDQVRSLDAQLGERTSERDSARSSVTEAQSRAASLEAELGEVKQERDGLRSTLEADQARLGKASEKWQQDQASLKQAKEALSAAVARIEEVEARPIG